MVARAFSQQAEDVTPRVPESDIYLLLKSNVGSNIRALCSIVCVSDSTLFFVYGVFVFMVFFNERATSTHKEKAGA